LEFRDILCQTAPNAPMTGSKRKRRNTRKAAVAVSANSLLRKPRGIGVLLLPVLFCPKKW